MGPLLFRSGGAFFIRGATAADRRGRQTTPTQERRPKSLSETYTGSRTRVVNLVIERGAERGFTKRQITYAREQMKPIALKRARKGLLLVFRFAPR